MFTVKHLHNCISIILLSLSLLWHFFRCDTKAKLDTTGRVYDVSLSAIEYAISHHAAVTVSTQTRSQTCQPSNVSRKEDVLLLNQQLPFNFGRQRVIDVHLHFEINHNIFDAMQKALLSVDSSLLEKLLPSKGYSWRRKRKPFRRIDKGILDAEYQEQALQKSINCDPTHPFLILGPFGTGKTRLLVNAAINLLKMRNNVVLVCTHMNRGADYFCEHYCNEFPCQRPRVRPFRVTIDDKNVNVPTSTNVVRPKDLTGQERLVVSTFQTGSLIRQQGMSAPFTHILIDEGAQSTEPEVLCALTLANSSTRIIIAGDNHQVVVTLVNKEDEHCIYLMNPPCHFRLGHRFLC